MSKMPCIKAEYEKVHFVSSRDRGYLSVLFCGRFPLKDSGKRIGQIDATPFRNSQSVQRYVRVTQRPSRECSLVSFHKFVPFAIPQF
jgi:hypothetical protein